MNMTLPSGYRAILESLLKPAELESYQACLSLEPLRAGWRLPWKKMAEHLRDFPALPKQRDSFLIPEGFQPGKDPAWHAGIYYCQEPSALHSLQELLKHGSLRSTFSKVVDLCAAPGGKTLLLKTILEKNGILIANEVDFKRSRILRENLERAGALDVIQCSYAPDELAARLSGWAELVWVDAPCSGEALFRRVPQSIKAWNIKEVLACSSRQRKILNSAIQLLEEGGVLVYSTCTFNHYENEGVIDALLSQYSGLRLISTQRFWPHLNEGEGQFVAIFVNTSLSPTAAQHQALEIRQKNSKSSVLKPFTSCLPEGEVYTFGDKIFFYPQSHLVCKYREFKRGILIGRIKMGKKTIEVPTHAMAMMLQGGVDIPSFELTFDEAILFLRGHELESPAQESGWILVTFEGQGLGWGKVVGSRLKNHYPGAFRIRD